MDTRTSLAEAHLGKEPKHKTQATPVRKTPQGGRQ